MFIRTCRRHTSESGGSVRDVAVPDESDIAGQILLLCPTGRDGPVTQKVLAAAGMAVRVCQNVDELCEAMSDAGATGALVIAEEAMVHPEIQSKVQGMLAAQPVWSDLPLVVLTARGTTRKLTATLAASLQPRTNVTFLERPLRVLTL